MNNADVMSIKTKKKIDPNMLESLAFRDTRACITKCFEVLGFKVLPNGMIKYPSGDTVIQPVSEVRNFYASLDKEQRKGILHSYFSDIIWKIVEEERLIARQKVKDLIGIYKPDEDQNLKRFCHLINPDDEMTYLVIENFIRQVKQKMRGIRVSCHLMPILVGKQDIGKTTLVRTLLLPLRYLYTEPSLNEITDTEKNYPLFQKNYVLLCEELSGAGKAEIEKLKAVITQEDVQARIFHSQDRMMVSNNATLIGTSNKFTWEVIKDATGNRRFIDLEMRGKVDFDSLEKIDLTALWQSVPFELSKEEENERIEQLKYLIAPIQEENRYRDDLEDFIEQLNLQSGQEYASYQWIFKEYSDFLKYLNKNTFLNVRSFSMQLHSRCHLKRTRKNDERGFLINLSCFLKAKHQSGMPALPDKTHASIPQKE